MSNYLLPNTAVSFTANASDKIATWSRGSYQITKIVGYPNLPNTIASVFSGSGANITAAFAAATSVTLTAGSSGLWYETGTAPAIIERPNFQGAPSTLNATGTLTAALILGGIVTSTSAAAVTATLDTGAAMDIAIALDIGDSFDWAVINTGPNTLTVTASTGHTIVGTATVVTVVSARWRTRKTAAGTYVSYRLA